MIIFVVVLYHRLLHSRRGKPQELILLIISVEYQALSALLLFSLLKQVDYPQLVNMINFY